MKYTERMQHLAGMKVVPKVEYTLYEELQQDQLLNENIFGDLLAGMKGAGGSMAADLSAATKKVTDAVTQKVTKYYETGKFAFNKNKATKELKELQQIANDLKASADKAKGIFEKVPNAMFSKEVAAFVQMLANVQMQVDTMQKALQGANFDGVEDGAKAPEGTGETPKATEGEPGAETQAEVPAGETKPEAENSKVPRDNAPADSPNRNKRSDGSAGTFLAFGESARNSLKAKSKNRRGEVTGWSIKVDETLKEKAAKLDVLNKGDKLYLVGKFSFKTDATALPITGVIIDPQTNDGMFKSFSFVTDKDEIISADATSVDSGYSSIADNIVKNG